MKQKLSPPRLSRGCRPLRPSPSSGHLGSGRFVPPPPAGPVAAPFLAARTARPHRRRGPSPPPSARPSVCPSQRPRGQVLCFVGALFCQVPQSSVLCCCSVLQDYHSCCSSTSYCYCLLCCSAIQQLLLCPRCCLHPSSVHCCSILLVACCCLLVSTILCHFFSIRSISSASSFACCLNYFAISYPSCMLLLASQSLSIQVQLHISSSSMPFVSTISLSNQLISYFYFG